MDDLIAFVLSFILNQPFAADLKFEDFQEFGKPEIYLVPPNELQEAACGCPCFVQGIYVGTDRHILVMNGYTDDNDMMHMDNSLLSGGLLPHEVSHYVQHLQYPAFFNKVDSTRVEVRHMFETESNEVQGLWVALHNRTPYDEEPIAEFSEMSTTLATAGSIECTNGETPLPEEDRLRLPDLLEFHNHGYPDVAQYLYSQHEE